MVRRNGFTLRLLGGGCGGRAERARAASGCCDCSRRGRSGYCARASRLQLLRGLWHQHDCPWAWFERWCSASEPLRADVELAGALAARRLGLGGAGHHSKAASLVAGRGVRCAFKARACLLPSCARRCGPLARPRQAVLRRTHCRRRREAAARTWRRLCLVARLVLGAVRRRTLSSGAGRPAPNLPRRNHCRHCTNDHPHAQDSEDQRQQVRVAPIVV